MINKTKRYLIPGILLIFSHLLMRLFHLTVIPVFCDEAIYIRWAQVMRAVQSLRFLPLSDGKQPLFMWLVIPFLKIFVNPLVAGRMVSVLAGLGTMVGIGLLCWILFKKRETALLSSLLYVITPFTLFFDRLALADGLLAMFGIWFLIFAVLLVRSLRLDLAMITGILLGLGLITKSPALFFALMLPLTFLFTRRGLAWQGLALMMVVYLFAFSIYNILRLGPEFHMIAIRNKDYVYSFPEILKHPLNPLVGHLKDVFSWYWTLLTPMVFISGIAGIYFSFKKNFKTGLFLLAWWILPIIGQSAIAKVFTARYVFFSVPIFLIFSGVALGKFWREVKNKYVVTFGLVLVFLLPMYQSFLLITFPQKAWLPKNERQGYLEMWTSGYGIKETADYLKETAKTQKVLVGTEGFFGTLPDGLQMYLESVPNITIIGVGQPVTEISSKLLSGLQDNKVFLLVNDSRLNISNLDKVELITKYPKAINSYDQKESLLFLKLKQSD